MKRLITGAAITLLLLSASDAFAQAVVDYRSPYVVGAGLTVAKQRGDALVAQTKGSITEEASLSATATNARFVSGVRAPALVRLQLLLSMAEYDGGDVVTVGVRTPTGFNLVAVFVPQPDDIKVFLEAGASVTSGAGEGAAFSGGGSVSYLPTSKGLARESPLISLSLPTTTEADFVEVVIMKGEQPGILSLRVKDVTTHVLPREP
jgi:hypothetical protein